MLDKTSNSVNKPEKSQEGTQVEKRKKDLLNKLRETCNRQIGRAKLSASNLIPNCLRAILPRTSSLLFKLPTRCGKTGTKEIPN